MAHRARAHVLHLGRAAEFIELLLYLFTYCPLEMAYSCLELGKPACQSGSELSGAGDVGVSCARSV